MFSACAARLMSLFAGVRMQLLFSTQYTAGECLTWADGVLESTSEHSIGQVVAPILNRAAEEPEFAVEQQKWMALVSGVISFTSAVEYFLQDLIILCLQRNAGLRKHAFSRCQVEALELEEPGDVDAIRARLIRSLADQNSGGPMFTSKLKKTRSFLRLKTERINRELGGALDDIWRLRNRLAHENHIAIGSVVIGASERKLELITRPPSAGAKAFDVDAYTAFVIGLCELMQEAVDFLRTVDDEALAAAPADSSVPR